MTVKELIKILLQYPENTEVFLMEEGKLKQTHSGSLLGKCDKCNVIYVFREKEK